MLYSYRLNRQTANRAKRHLAALLLLFVFLPAIGFAESYIVENSEGTFEVRVFSTHVEVTDSAGTVSIISTEGDIVDIETFSTTAGHTVSSTDTSEITVTQEEQDAYDKLMGGTTVSSSGHDTGGDGGISPDPIFQESNGISSKRLVTSDASIQSWDCANALIGFAASAAGMIGSCSSGALFYCPAAVVGYVTSAISVSSNCG